MNNKLISLSSFKVAVFILSLGWYCWPSTATAQQLRDDTSRISSLGWYCGTFTATAPLLRDDTSLPPGAPASKGSVLLPGEHVRLFVAEDASFDGIYQIRQGGYLVPPTDAAGAGPGGRVPQVRVGGYIILPTVGRVLVFGMTLPEAEKAVGAAIEAAKLLAHATVTLKRVDRRVDGPDRFNGQIVAADPPSIYVIGRVMRPRSFPVGPGDEITVQAAIAGAGGFAKFSDLDKIYVLRITPGGGLVKIPVDMRAIENGVTRGIPLEPQDILVVPEKFYID